MTDTFRLSGSLVRDRHLAAMGRAELAVYVALRFAADPGVHVLTDATSIGAAAGIGSASAVRRAVRALVTRRLVHVVSGRVPGLPGNALVYHVPDAVSEPAGAGKAKDLDGPHELPARAALRPGRQRGGMARASGPPVDLQPTSEPQDA